MKVCPYCGNDNVEGAESCAFCGSDLVTHSIPPLNRGRRKKKIIRTVCLVLLSVCLVVGITLVTVTVLSPSFQLNRAVKKTWNSMIYSVKKQDDLQLLIDNINTITKSKKASFQLETKTGTESFNLLFDYNQRRKSMQGDLTFQADGESGNVQFALKNGVLQAKIPDISDDVYGISLKKANNSTTIHIIQEALNLDVSSVFSKEITQTIDGYMTGVQEIWNDFCKNIKVEALKKQGKLRVYHVTWSANDLVEAISGKKIKGVSKELVNLLEKIDGGCTCYVSQHGQLNKIEAIIGAALYQLNFSSDENPWEQISVTSSLGNATLFQGGVISNDLGFRAFLANDQGEDVLDINYTESNGAFSYISKQITLKGFVTHDGPDSAVHFLNNKGSTISFEFGKLKNMPQLLSRKYVDLLDLSASDISMLTIKATSNSDKIEKGWKIIESFIKSLIAT